MPASTAGPDGAARLTGMATESSTGTLEPVVHLDEASGAVARRKRRALYLCTTVVLSVLMFAALFDWLTDVAVFGVEDETVRASGGGFDLEVNYASLSRPALATPLDIIVTRPGGFDEPLTLALTGTYFDIWDENALSPQPDAETSDAERLLLTFEPPANSDTMRISYDGRVEPTAQRGRRGAVAIVDENDDEIVTASFRTRLLP
jgi:hypothetical protein